MKHFQEENSAESGEEKQITHRSGKQSKKQKQTNKNSRQWDPTLMPLEIKWRAHKLKGWHKNTRFYDAPGMTLHRQLADYTIKNAGASAAEFLPNRYFHKITYRT